MQEVGANFLIFAQSRQAANRALVAPERAIEELWSGLVEDDLSGPIRRGPRSQDF